VAECLDALGKFQNLKPSGNRGKYQEYKVEISKPKEAWPEDAVAGAIYADPQSMSFLVVLYHESFPEVPAGEVADMVRSELDTKEVYLYKTDFEEKSRDEIYKEGYDQGVVDGSISTKRRLTSDKDKDGPTTTKS
jgi:hypothetical protein